MDYLALIIKGNVRFTAPDGSYVQVNGDHCFTYCGKLGDTIRPHMIGKTNTERNQLLAAFLNVNPVGLVVTQTSN